MLPLVDETATLAHSLVARPSQRLPVDQAVQLRVDEGVDSAQLGVEATQPELHEARDVDRLHPAAFLQAPFVEVSVAVEIVREPVETVDVVSPFKEDGCLDQPRHAAVSVSERMDGHQEEVGEQRSDHRMLVPYAPRVDEDDEVVQQLRELLVRCSQVDSSQIRRTHLHAVCSQPAGYVVSFIGAPGEQFMHSEDVRHRQRCLAGSEPFANPVLGGIGILDLSRFPSCGAGFGFTIQQFAHLRFRQRVALEGGRATDRPDAIQSVELVPPIRGQQKFLDGLPTRLDFDEKASQAGAVEAVFEAERLPIHILRHLL